MFGTSHAAVGISASLVLQLSSPVAAFAVGWATHYACDAVPHGDTVPKNATALERQGWRDLTMNVAILDSCLLIWLWHHRNRKHGHSWVVTAAAVGSVAPDALQITENLLEYRFLWGVPEAIHRYCHNPLGLAWPFWIGWPPWFLMGLGLWWWILRYRRPPVFRSGS
jgi:hypothetical protein